MPPSLHKYIRRCFNECVTIADKDTAKVIIKGKITEAATCDILWTKNWEEESLPANLIRKVEPSPNYPSGSGSSRKLEELHVGNAISSEPPSKKQKLIYNKSTSPSISIARGREYYNNNSVLNSKTSDPYQFPDIQSPSTSSILSSTPQTRTYFQLIQEKSLGKPSKWNDVPTKQEIWSKFTNIFYFSKNKLQAFANQNLRKKKGFSNQLKDVLSSNPYYATNEDVYDFLFYIDLTEKLNNCYFQAILSTINFYRHDDNHLDDIEVYHNIKKGIPRFEAPWILVPNQVKSLPILLDIPGISKDQFNDFKGFCDAAAKDIDPFRAPPRIVYGYIKSIFENMTDNYSSVLKPHIDFYQDNVKTILRNFSYFMEYPLTNDDWLEDSWIKEIVEAAKACDEKLHGNSFAISLLPFYNYTRARVNKRHSEKSYWTSSFLKKVFHDLKKDTLSLHAAA